MLLQNIMSYNTRLYYTDFNYHLGGMGMHGRKYSSTSQYRYGFNGKEKDNDAGEGKQDYGMRIFDTRLVRFMSTDPMAKKYPELTSYQFASNTPIQAIDLDGLEAFFVHGTNSNSSRWTQTPQAKQAVHNLLELTNNKFLNTKFNWKAVLWNNEKTRGKAAIQLATYVMENRIEGEDITLIGHSHGGNLAIQAAKILYERTGQKINIITIATPAYNKEGDVENPKTQKKYINDHIAIWNKIDGVSGGLAGDDFYTNSTITNNFELNVDKHYKQTHYNGKTSQPYTVENPIGAHSADVEHPEILKDKSLRKLKPVTSTKKV